MPYVVTTYKNGPWPHTTAMRDVQTRRAVATLEQAWNHIQTQGVPMSASMHDLGAPEQGGTITLPDGTVIEVKRVSWDALPGGSAVDATGDVEGGLFPHEVIAAYNAAQET